MGDEIVIDQVDSTSLRFLRPRLDVLIGNNRVKSYVDRCGSWEFHHRTLVQMAHLVRWKNLVN